MATEQDEPIDELPGADPAGDASADNRPWPPAWFGAASTADADVAGRAEELLAAGFARRR